MKYLIFCLTVIFTIPLTAQKYNTAMGIRMGDELGYSLKQRVFKKVTAEFVYEEGIITDKQFASATLQQHHNLIGKRVNFYVGAGYFNEWESPEEIDQPIALSTGIPMTFGAEITIGRINISTDVMPIYYLTGSNKSSFSKRSGISLRYVFWKRKGSISKLWDKVKFWN